MVEQKNRNYEDNMHNDFMPEDLRVGPHVVSDLYSHAWSIAPSLDAHTKPDPKRDDNPHKLNSDCFFG
ncbi:hypothetical protein HN747_00210 [archaeon]|jgi:hypothetical protein|nr:hypothetical protein [archaeon]